MLQYEASTNVVDAKGSSPLHLAAWAGDAEIVRLILTQGPSVPKVNLTVSKFILFLFFFSLFFFLPLKLQSNKSILAIFIIAPFDTLYILIVLYYYKYNEHKILKNKVALIINEINYDINIYQLTRTLPSCEALV